MGDGAGDIGTGDTGIGVEGAGAGGVGVEAMGRGATGDGLAAGASVAGDGMPGDGITGDGVADPTRGASPPGWISPAICFLRRRTSPATSSSCALSRRISSASRLARAHAATARTSTRAKPSVAIN